MQIWPTEKISDTKVGEFGHTLY